MKNDIFLIDDLLSKIGEAESLQAQVVELLHCDDKLLRNAFALRWAVVADEATRLIILAEEQLSEEQILEIKQTVDSKYPGCWEGYRENSGRLAQLSSRDETFR
jgi:hypothetical protein